MEALTLPFSDIAPEDLPRVGGKAANLGTLARAGLPVPPGFCVTTPAFDRFLAPHPDADRRFAALEALDGTSAEAARSAAGAMRGALESLSIPGEVASAVVTAWRALGPDSPVAVRSSATAEDLPGASFAGQQDSFLNVRGEGPLLDAVRRCWISLFTDRAVLYRARGRFGHRSVRLAVVVQRMIDPDVSGILFTADPVSGHRRIASIDTGFGLGEALVSGLVSADLYRVDRKTGRVLVARPGDKSMAIRPAPDGGTRRENLPDALRRARALSDEQARTLADIGGRIEALYGGVPQDIEWCLAKGAIHIVQARPITSLYPLPRTETPDDELRVYVSFGHLQMMLDPMPRLAQEIWRHFFPASKDAHGISRAMVPAGGRLYLDVTGVLRHSRLRGAVVGILSHVYEALGRTLARVAERPEIRRCRGGPGSVLVSAVRLLGPVLIRIPGALLFRDPDKGAAAFGRAIESIPREFEARVREAADPAARIRRCAAELGSLFKEVRPHLSRMAAGFLALARLRLMARGRWADGVRDEVDALMRGVPGNVTTRMDLAVGDLADLVRPVPDVAEKLRTLPWSEARGQLPPALRAAFDDFLARYGNRGAGEIDASRPRWRDDPSLLVRVMIGGLDSEAGAHRRHYEAQVAAGEAAGAKLIAAAGFLRRRRVRRLVHVARVGMGLREHPKFLLVQVLGVVRTEILAAGDLLAGRGQLAASGDVWHLEFDEVAAALEDATLDVRGKVVARAAEFRLDRSRRPPLAMTSEGEMLSPDLDRSGLPADALPGTGASAGVVEGIARVVTDPSRDVLKAGEILVAPFTDPGWTPLFVLAAGLVTEVGGLMTHGAVVAREYGIPAVVSVASAVERIKTGQRIRVDGTRGFVQILATPEPPAR